MWSWRVAINEWREWSRREQGAPETTLRTRTEHLGLLAKSIGVAPFDVTGEHLRDWFETRGADWAANTRRSRRTTLRAFYGWAVLVGKMATSPAIAIPRQPVPIARPMPVPDRTYAEALAAARGPDRLMMRLAAEHGLRRAEIAVVHPKRDMFPDLDGWSMVVHGKGGRERVVPLLDDIARELLRLGDGYAFPGRIDGHISPQWVGKRLARLLPGQYTGHKLRHRAGTRWYAESEDLALVQDLLGHADPKTTRVYVAVGAARKRAVVRASAG